MYKKNTIIITIIVIVIIFFVISYIIYKYKYDTIKDIIVDIEDVVDNIKGSIEDIPDVQWPFINLKDENDKNINMLCVRGPFNSDNSDGNKNKKMFKKWLKSGIKFIGCSSYLSFPGLCENEHGTCHIDDDNLIDGNKIEDYVIGWCHCFREPDKYIKNDIPKILISESDFNSDQLTPKPDINIKIKYDFVMFQPSDDECDYGWNSHNKNWNLAEHCIKIMCDKYNLKGVIIGRGDCLINVDNKKNITSTPFIEYDKAIQYIHESKMMISCNYEDASPRTITEALSLNTPIMVNEDILGGWKYVSPESGLFFNEHNFEEKLNELYNLMKTDKLTPREYYINNYTIKHSGKQLRDFLKSINPELSDCEYVRFPIS
jgi:hypothetical protein